MGTANDTEYIPREAVDNVLLKLEDRVINNPFALTAMAMAIDKIDNIPAADVAPFVYGHWIHLGGGLAKCSVCKRVVKDCYDQDNEDPFCRKCGAKMGESEDNNNV